MHCLGKCWRCRAIDACRGKKGCQNSKKSSHVVSPSVVDTAQRRRPHFSNPTHCLGASNRKYQWIGPPLTTVVTRPIFKVLDSFLDTQRTPRSSARSQLNKSMGRVHQWDIQINLRRIDPPFLSVFDLRDRCRGGLNGREPCSSSDRLHDGNCLALQASERWLSQGRPGHKR